MLSPALQEAAMVSIDHFRHELLAQMSRAATNGRIDVLINSGELCRSIPTGSAWSTSCCDAMEAEMKLGDILLVERASGVGMTVRYFLPRPN
jgi:hypothetical protein